MSLFSFFYFSLHCPNQCGLVLANSIDKYEESIETNIFKVFHCQLVHGWVFDREVNNSFSRFLHGLITKIRPPVVLSHVGQK